MKSEDSELAHPLDQDHFETLNVEINGRPRKDQWQPISMRLVTEEYDGRPFRTVDAPWLGCHALVFKREVVESLGGYLNKWGELLPLDCEDRELFVYNPRHSISALNEEESAVVRFSSGRIMMIKQHAFIRQKLVGIEVFKIPNLRVSSTYVTQGFVDQWLRAGLTGIEFELVWRSAKTA